MRRLEDDSPTDTPAPAAEPIRIGTPVQDAAAKPPKAAKPPVPPPAPRKTTTF